MPTMEALRELRNAAQEVLDGLHRRIDDAPKHAVPVFSGIALLHGAILKADAALSAPSPALGGEDSSGAVAPPIDPDTQKAAASTLVYCVRCIDDDGDVVHIFSSQETLQKFLDTDPRRGRVIYGYIIDHPERMEQVKQ